MSQQYAPQYQQYPQYPQQQSVPQYNQQYVPQYPQQNGQLYPTLTPAKLTDEQLQQQKELEEKEKPKYIIHKIDYSDSLDGLALQYSVSAREIKIFNGLTTDDIYYLKELKIPNPDLQNLHTVSEEVNAEEYRRQQKLHTMRMVMEKDDHKAAKFYLEDNNWDVNKAIDNYKSDLEFEKKYQKVSDQQQILNKKKY